jgi:hypothetical protein
MTALGVENVKKRVAVFWSVEHCFESVFAQNGLRDDDWCMAGWVRRTEWADIEFAPLTNAAMAESALAAIAQERAQVVTEFTRKLARLDEQAANYRAICAPVSL